MRGGSWGEGKYLIEVTTEEGADYPTERPSEFADAVEFDKKIRQGSRSIKDEVFLHRKCIPLDEVEFNKKETDKQLDMFNNECEGMCGV